jgi:hypothetical protein
MWQSISMDASFFQMHNEYFAVIIVRIPESVKSN